MDDAFNNALKHLGTGRLAEAESLLRNVLSSEPNRLEALEALAGLRYQLGDMSGAAEAFGRAVSIAPQLPHLRASLGAVLAAQKRYDDAAAELHQAVSIDPRNPQILVHLAAVLSKLGQLDPAIETYRRAIALQPHFPEAYNNLGTALMAAGRHEESAAAFQAAVSQKPNFAEAHNNLAALFREIGRLEESIAAARHAIELRQDFADAHYNLGVALTLAGRHAPAAAALKKAVALRPDSLLACFALATTSARLHELDTALSAYRRCVELDPARIDARVEIGYVLLQLGRLDEALATHRQTLGLYPQCADAQFALSSGVLLKGDLSNGWPLYEARRKVESLALHDPPQPRWTGEPLDGKRILLHVEQGLGDVIHFIRYVPLVRLRGGRVLIRAYEQLRRLLTGQLGIERFVSDVEPLPECEVQFPLLSLPRVFETTLETIPAEVPYLFADPTLAPRWRQKVASAPDGLRVGLVWAGSGAHRFDRERSISLSQLAPLANVKGAQFFSLQVGAAASQAKTPPPGMVLHDFSNDLSDLTDTAALVANLDLIICVDTVVAHLAGALGKPVWLMLQFIPDWRWLLRRTDSPWYPTMRLFRQTAYGDWDGVIEAVAAALGDYATEHAAFPNPCAILESAGDGIQ